MSGEITVTRGKSWSAGERVDYAKLNQTGAPTARVDEDAITSRELLLDGSGSAADTALASAIVSRNLFRNPELSTDQWLGDSEGITATAGEKTENALAWWVNPEGADTLTKRSTSVPDYADGGKVANSLEIQGAASVTTVDIGQFVTSWIAGPLTSGYFTVSAWIYNATGSAFTPVVRIGYPTSSTDGFDAITHLTTGNGSSCANQQWTKITVSLNAASLTQISDGMQVAIRIPSGQLGASGRLVRVAQLQLVPGQAASTWVPPQPEPLLHEYGASRAPGVNDDMADGFSPGSVWFYDSDVYLCTDATVGAAVWAQMTLEVRHVVDLAHTETSGTEGGTATSGSWEIRPINTVMEDTGNLTNESLENPVAIDSTGAFTLPAGTWQFDIDVPGHRCDSFRARLYNVTADDVMEYQGTTTDIYGTSAYADATNAGNAVSVMRGRFRLTDATKLRVEGRVGATRASDGMGKAGSIGTEVYTRARFTLISL